MSARLNPHDVAAHEARNARIFHAWLSGRTYAWIARDYGLSRERVSRIIHTKIDRTAMWRRTGTDVYDLDPSLLRATVVVFLGVRAADEEGALSESTRSVRQAMAEEADALAARERARRTVRVALSVVSLDAVQPPEPR